MNKIFENLLFSLVISVLLTLLGSGFVFIMSVLASIIGINNFIWIICFLLLWTSVYIFIKIR